MRLLGMIHILLCRIPKVGISISLALSRFFSIFPWLAGVRGSTSIEQTRQQLIDAGERMNFGFEFSEVDGDEFILELPSCPYGFNRTEHQRPCDTAMEMDKTLLRMADAELIITDTIPKGASRCRMIVRRS